MALRDVIRDITEENFNRIVELHIRRYSNRIKQAEINPTGIRVGECVELLGLWGRIKLIGYEERARIPESAKCELLDAIYDEME